MRVVVVTRCVVTPRKLLDWLLIVALTGSWAVLCVRGIGEGLRTQRGYIGVVVLSAHQDDYPRVLTGSGAILAGDRLLSVDDQDLRGASSLGFHDLATRSARARLRTRAGRARGGGLRRRAPTDPA